MKYKTLLLGTAAVVAVAGSARAADLAVAESVEYVKVCDAYGTGYFYVPGSDTCLKIGGDLQFQVFGELARRQESAGDISHGAQFGEGSTGGTGQDEMSWWYRTRAEVNLTAKSMTDWGLLTFFLNERANHDLGVSEAGSTFYTETAWAKIGGFKVGWDASTFDAGFLGASDEFFTNFDHDQHQGQVQWSTTVGGWGFFIAAEDPQDNPSTLSNIFTGTSPLDENLTAAPISSSVGEWKGDWPDIVAALTGGAGNFHWKGSFGVTDTTVGTGYGGMLWGQWLQNGNSVTLQAAASNGPGALYGANIQPDGYGTGTYWHVSGQVGWALTNAFTVLLEGGYQKTPGPSAWEAGAEADWTVGKGAVFALEYYYLNHNLPSGYMNAQSTVDFMFKRSFD